MKNPIEKILNEIAENIVNDENAVQKTETIHEDNQHQILYDPNFYTLDTTLVRVRIKECDLTLIEVQKKIGVAYRTLIRWLSKDDFPQQQNLCKLAEVLQVEPHQLVYRNRKYGNDIHNENKTAIRYIQRRIEAIVTEILEDTDTTNEKKLDALLKYHNILLKAAK